jgi:hypothetical protein
VIKTPERPTAALERRRDLYSVKIQQEEEALFRGTSGPGSPADYKYVTGQSREQRLAEWKQVLGELEAELIRMGIPATHTGVAQTRTLSPSPAPRGYTALPDNGRGSRDGRSGPDAPCVA